MSYFSYKPKRIKLTGEPSPIRFILENILPILEEMDEASNTDCSIPRGSHDDLCGMRNCEEYGCIRLKIAEARAALKKDKP